MVFFLLFIFHPFLFLPIFLFYFFSDERVQGEDGKTNLGLKDSKVSIFLIFFFFQKS